ncbi:MAG: hypothetical protein M1544_00890 [Candidatus Marsarchaeota archaeon]|nr:hypothetical protein [Candidatus Marsarchaeota archaeon]
MESTSNNQKNIVNSEIQSAALLRLAGYTKKAVDYKSEFISSQLIKYQNSLVKIIFGVLKPNDTIGMIPNGSAGPLLNIVKDINSEVEKIYSTVRGEVLELIGDSEDLYKSVELSSSEIVINTKQLPELADFRKEQRKRVRKPRVRTRLDGKMTPSSYATESFTKEEAKNIYKSTKKRLSEEQKKAKEEIKKSQDKVSKLKGSTNASILAEAKGLMQNREYSEMLIGAVISKSKIADQFIRIQDLQWLDDSIKIYKEMLRRDKENSMVNMGTKEMESFFDILRDDMIRVNNMLSKGIYEPKIDQGIAAVVYPPVSK